MSEESLTAVILSDHISVALTGEVTIKYGHQQFTKPLREWFRLALPQSNPCPCCEGTGSADLPPMTDGEMCDFIAKEIRGIGERLDNLSKSQVGPVWQNGKRIR